ncbi:MAG: sugar ABC transporter ATP-binding protein [Aeromicrobium erythreum]
MTTPVMIEVGETVLSVKGLSKSFLGNRALVDVDLEVRRGEILALLGGNGSGKSTLIKVLAGVHQADDGGTIGRLDGHPVGVADWSARRSREAGLLFVHQSLGLFPGLTVAENMAIGHGFPMAAPGVIARGRMRRRAAALVERFEIAADPDQLVETLRPADQTMVAIARALQDQEDDDAAVLFLDEPTASLPVAEVEVLHRALRRYAAAGQTIVYVSHRLDEVQQLADRVVVLKDGVKVADLPTTETSPVRLAELITGLDVTPKARTAPTHGDDVVLRVRDLRAAPLDGVSFDLRRGEVLGIAGLLGSGRTELLRSLFGHRPFEGTVELCGAPFTASRIARAMALGVAYVPEDRAVEAAFGEQSILENLSIGRLGDFWRGLRLRRRAEREAATASAAEFLVKAASIDQPLATLSGGNQQKVVLARWLARRPSLILLDEPTQGVDVGARREIYSLVRRATEQGASVVVVSSDMEELAAACDRVLVLHGGRIVGELGHAALSSSSLTSLLYQNQTDRTAS